MDRTLGLTICLAAALPILAAPAEAAVTDEQKCEAAVELAAGKYAQCRLKAESKFTKSEDGGVLTTALLTCDERLEASYSSAFEHYGGSCPTVEPVSTFEAYLTQCADETEDAAAGGAFPVCGDAVINVAGEQCDGGDVGGETCASLGFASGTLGCTIGCVYDTSGCARQSFPATGQMTCWDPYGLEIPCAGTRQDGDVQAGGTLAYVDNGDGTITDVNTGLMWEKLSNDGSFHDMDSTWTWRDASESKLSALNSGSFAGHSDWRLPNVKELQSIVNYQNAEPSVPAAFNTGCAEGCTVLTCSCTAPSDYWSSTTLARFDSHSLAWVVRFSSGYVIASVKGYSYAHVRAVRGGS